MPSAFGAHSMIGIYWKAILLAVNKDVWYNKLNFKSILNTNPMLETSKDLLYIVIAFCVLWFTIFVCWLLYYFISIIKNAHDLIKSVKDKVGMVGDLIENVKGKVDNSAAYVGLIANGVMKVVDIVKDKKAKPDKKNGEKTKKEKEG